MARRKPLPQQDADGLLKAMLVLSRTVDHVLEARAAEVVDEPLSKSKIRVLRLLGQSGMQTSTQLARFLGVTKPAVTQIVDSMVRRRLITRRKSRQDRRGVELKLTPKGNRIFLKVRNEQRRLIRSAVREEPVKEASRWINTMRQITGDLARADEAFEHYCLQCGAHADGTCVLDGGNAACPFLQHQGDVKKRARRKKARAQRARR